MKIFVIGKGTDTLIFAEYVKACDKKNDIFVTGNTNPEDSECTFIDISVENIRELVDFAENNEIDFTVVLSSASLINGVADAFKNAGLCIFAPYAKSAGITFFNSIAKKIMYKLKIPSAKFGIFDKENIADEFIRNAKFPLTIKNDLKVFEENEFICNTYSQAKTALRKIFDGDEKKAVIEKYYKEKPYYIYFITDGYNALPLISLQEEKHENYIEIMSDVKKVTEDMTLKILKTVIYPFLDDTSEYSNGYTGILGIKIKIRGNSYIVCDFYDGFRANHLQTFLSSVDEDVLKLMYDTACGKLNRNYVMMKDGASYTICTDSKNILPSLSDDTELFMSEYDGKISLTSEALSLNGAKETLLSEIQMSESFQKEINGLLSDEGLRI